MLVSVEYEVSFSSWTGHGHQQENAEGKNGNLKALRESMSLLSILTALVVVVHQFMR